MLRFATLAAAAAAAALVAIAPVGASAQSTTTMQPGQRMQLGAMMGDRTIREVMVGPEGSITLVFNNKDGTPQSQRALRVENVNGMLEVVYDTTVPTMATGSGGIPTLVQRGGGMYSVEYARR
jgi:hypothetical protein